MIKVNNLVKNYDNKPVLKGVSFEVKENEIYALLGPNGAGKTTTLECIEGLRSFDQGSVLLANKTPHQAISAGLIGVQLQSSSLFRNISVLEAMEFICRSQNCDVSYDLLDQFDLMDQKNKKYKTLSTGQKRKLHLALALAHQPKILILDEPTAGLDVQARATLHKQIKQLKQQGMTMILASHDMSEVEDLCDRIGILLNGNLIKEGTPLEIINEVKEHTILKIKTSEAINYKDVKALSFLSQQQDYDVCSTDNLHDGLATLMQWFNEKNIELLDLIIEKPTLEQRFIDIANKEGV